MGVGLRQTCPDAELPGLDGRPRPLADAWRGGPALLFIGHGECPTSRLTLPFVDRIHRRRGPGATVLAVLQDEPQDAAALAAELGLELPLLLDREPFAFGERLGLEVVPTLLHVAAGGSLQRVVEGFDREALEALAAASGVAGPLIPVSETTPRLRPG